MATTALKLPPALERFIAAQVEKGLYRSRRAAIVAAVSNEERRVSARMRLDVELERGLESEVAGEWDVENVIRRGRRRAAECGRRAHA